MELKLYWRIIRRRLWVILLLVAFVSVGSAFLGPKLTPRYQASLRLTVGIVPEERKGEYYAYDLYYTWVTAEYLTDDFSEIVKSQAFAADVSQLLGEAIPVGVIQGSAAAQKQHRILTLTVTMGDPEQALAIAKAAAEALHQQGSKYLAQLGATNAVIQVIDPPTLSGPILSLRERFDLPIRIFLAFIAGIGLAFLLDYLDDTICDAGEVEALGMAVLGEIPPHPRRGGLPWRRYRLP